jgi:general secretion pathway protein D
VVLLITPHVVRNIQRPDVNMERFNSGTEAAIGGSSYTVPSASPGTAAPGTAAPGLPEPAPAEPVPAAPAPGIPQNLPPAAGPQPQPQPPAQPKQ